MLQCQVSDLGVQGLEIRGLRRWWRPAKDVCDPGQQVLLQSMICVEGTLNCSTNSTSVVSSLPAAHATCALKVAP